MNRRERIRHVERPGDMRHAVYILRYDCGCFYIGKSVGSYRYRYKGSGASEEHRTRAIRVKGDYLTWGSKEYCEQAEKSLVRYAADLTDGLEGCGLDRNTPLLNCIRYKKAEPEHHKTIEKLSRRWHSEDYPYLRPRFYLPPERRLIKRLSMSLGLEPIRKGTGKKEGNAPRPGHWLALAETAKLIAELTDDYWVGLFVLQHQAIHRCKDANPDPYRGLPLPPPFGEVMGIYRTPTEAELNNVETVRMPPGKYYYHRLLP